MCAAELRVDELLDHFEAAHSIQQAFRVYKRLKWARAAQSLQHVHRKKTARRLKRAISHAEQLLEALEHEAFANSGSASHLKLAKLQAAWRGHHERNQQRAAMLAAEARVDELLKQYDIDVQNMPVCSW